jgi:hypothetical protein
VPIPAGAKYRPPFLVCDTKYAMQRLIRHLHAQLAELQLKRAFLLNRLDRTVVALVSDLDGTLLDTEPLYLEAYNRC